MLPFTVLLCVKRRGDRWRIRSYSRRTGCFETYRLRAAECMELAQRLLDATAKLTLLHMAQAWMELAEQADKNSETAVVYKTREPRQHIAQQQQQPQSDEDKE